MPFYPLFLFGFFTAVIGVLPPGLLNLSVAKIGLQEGRKKGISFAFGAVSVILLQSYIAVLFSRYININSYILVFLEELGFFIFFILTIYFLYFAEKKQPSIYLEKKRTNKNRFLLGMFLSLINIFPIPFYVLVSLSLSERGLFFFSYQEIIRFVLGVVSGSFLMFYLYLIFFKRLESEIAILIKNSNYIIGSLTALVSLITLFKIVKTYFL